MAFATEFQGDATPHGHGFLSLANMYQHATLDDIAQHIKANGKTAIDRILKFWCHLACEDHIDNDRHQRNLNALEKGFHATYQTVKDSLLMGAYISDMAGTSDVPGKIWQSQYENEVQAIQSRVQHHWHLKDDKGNEVPIAY